MATRCLDCHELIARGSRCEDCARGRRSRGTQATFRRRVLRRDRFTCQQCGRVDRSGRTLRADHRRPIAAGGSHDTRNGQTLCADCHLEKGRRDERLAIARGVARELLRGSR